MAFDPTLLASYAAKYIWWKTSADAIKSPARVIAQIMDIGDYADVLTLIDLVGEDTLREVLQNAEIGMFSPRSWAYWHYRLGLAEPECVPPLPQRRLA